jgi:hypothetical protein
MARKRSESQTLESVKLPSDVMASARIVAAYTGEPMAEMLGGILRPVLAKREREEAAKRERSLRKTAGDESGK